MLKLTLAKRGLDSRVELDGVDISHFLCGARVETDVHGLTTATLHYRGAVVVEMSGGELTLVQSPVYVTCDQCATARRGAPADPRTIQIDAAEPALDRDSPSDG